MDIILKLTNCTWDNQSSASSSDDEVAWRIQKLTHDDNTVDNRLKKIQVTNDNFETNIIATIQQLQTENMNLKIKNGLLNDQLAMKQTYNSPNDCPTNGSTRTQSSFDSVASDINLVELQFCTPQKDQIVTLADNLALNERQYESLLTKYVQISRELQAFKNRILINTNSSGCADAGISSARKCVGTDTAIAASGDEDGMIRSRQISVENAFTSSSSVMHHNSGVLTLTWSEFRGLIFTLSDSDFELNSKADQGLEEGSNAINDYGTNKSCKFYDHCTNESHIGSPIRFVNQNHIFDTESKNTKTTHSHENELLFISSASNEDEVRLLNQLQEKINQRRRRLLQRVQVQSPCP